MKVTAKRLLGAGVIGIAAIVTPLALTVALPGVASAPSSVAGAAAFDQIMFNQTTSSPADTFVYAPAGGGQTAQTANVSGSCATAAGGAAPILSVCGEVYPSGNYSGTPKAASLGTSGPATGVGAVSPAWTIDNKSTGNKTQAEAIYFSPGSNVNVIGPGRVFADAQIPVQRKDTGVAENASVSVQLAEYSSTTPSAANLLGTQNCVIAGNTGTQITADPDNASACTPVTGPPAAGGGVAVPSGFQTIEVRDMTTSTSISVVGPTATFELLTQICGGQQINPVDEGGGVQATLTLTGVSTQCKTYTTFTSTVNAGLPSLSFNGLTGSNVQFTIQVTWPAVPLCNPYVDTAPNNLAQGGTTGIPNEPGLAQNECAVHSFSFDGTTFYDQAYCQSAQAAGGVNPDGSAVVPQQELCTVAKSYNNDTISYTNGTACPAPNNPPCIPVTTPILLPDGSAGTQITETWVGFVDMRLH